MSLPVRLAIIILVLLLATVAWLTQRPGTAVNVPLASLLGGAHFTEQQLAAITIPRHFEPALVTNALGGARDLLLLPDGDLLVSQTRPGRISRIISPASDAPVVVTWKDGLELPSGLAWQDGQLYLAETGGVSRVTLDAALYPATEPEPLLSLPPYGNHATRTLGFSPSGILHISTGSSCNVCIEEQEYRATLLQFNPATGDTHIIAKGLRNSVGFDWSPVDGHLYATDNGRDLLGDDFPPCELNRIEDGQHYGWPYRNGNNIPDPDYGDALPAGLNTQAPVHAFRAHNAPLGIHFLRHQPEGSIYQHAALVALHGSWNRTEKDGYKVVSLHWQDDRIIECPFMTGFENGGTVIGRPAYITENTQGTIFISDDHAGSVYRLRPTKAATDWPEGCREDGPSQPTR
ncbi:MAG: sorbosone dehydrogenase family protein [Gammaproteobacteria bacterium]|nr:MAG: sorbosone dehydrogenase family protein [Gammaproteobacteria bacterium]